MKILNETNIMVSMKISNVILYIINIFIYYYLYTYIRLNNHETHGFAVTEIDLGR